MPEYPTLHSQRRTVLGKKVNQLRLAGLTPIVVYGANTEAVSLQVETKELVNVLQEVGGTQLIAIEIDGDATPRIALAREVQRHVTRLTPLHADFLQVDITQVITSAVPLIFEGQAPLVKQGEAILQTPLNEVSVEALPPDLPASITIDASHLQNFEDAIHVRDLDLGDKVRILDDPDELLARLAPSRKATVAGEPDEILAEDEALAGEAAQAHAEGDASRDGD